MTTLNNYTYDFFILNFPTHAKNKSCLSVIFVLVYMTGVLSNALTILVIYNDAQLQTPMYLFLCNLSMIDLCYTTITVPKLVHMFLSGDYTMSFAQCFTQMYFFSHMATTEDLVLFIMAYDRYVAICNPLHYHSVLSKKNCILFMSIAWISGFVNSFVVILASSKAPMCYSNMVSQFFCEYKAFEKIFCPNARFQLISYLEALIFGLSPFMGSLISYIKVIIVILHIRSSDGRKKAFSTCSSHLMVLSMCYGTWISVYIMPPSEFTRDFELTLSVLYTTVTPMLNPVVYSIRNKDVKRAVLKLVGIKRRIRSFSTYI